MTTADWSRLWILILLCNVSTLLPLLFLRCLPEKPAALQDIAQGDAATDEVAEDA